MTFHRPWLSGGRHDLSRFGDEDHGFLKARDAGRIAIEGHRQEPSPGFHGPSRLPSVVDERRGRGGPMTDVLQQEGPAQRLAGEGVGWLTTVGAEGQPQSSPVWFIWDGASLWLRSQAQAGKVRNIRPTPKWPFISPTTVTAATSSRLRAPPRSKPDHPHSPRRTSRSTTKRSERHADVAGAARRGLLDHDPDRPTRIRAW